MGDNTAHTYVMIAPSNQYFHLANDEEDNISHGEKFSTIQHSETPPNHSITINNGSPSSITSGIRQNILNSTHIVGDIPNATAQKYREREDNYFEIIQKNFSGPSGENIFKQLNKVKAFAYKKGDIHAPFREAIAHHYPDPITQATILYRFQLIVHTKKFKEQEKKCLEEASSLKALIGKRMDEERLEPENLVIKGERPSHIEGPSGAKTTFIDYYSQFKNLSSEEQEWCIENDFKKNGDDFFTIPEFKNSIIKLCEDTKYFGLQNIQKIKDVMIKINTFSQFKEEMLKQENIDIVPFFLSLNRPLKRLFDGGITPEAVKNATNTLESFSNSINTLDTIDTVSVREKSWERINLKFLHKGKLTYTPGDLAGMRIVCKSGTQEETAYQIKERLEAFGAENSSLKIKVNTPEDSNAKEKKGGERFGEFKVEGTINGIGFEIQINDANGYSNSETNERAHFIYEYVRTLAVKSRLMDTIPQNITEGEVEEWVRSSLSKNYKYLNKKSLESTVVETMKLFHQYGFFMQGEDNKNIFVDYQQLFANKYRTSEHYREIITHFSSNLNEKLKQWGENSFLSEQEWTNILHDPLSFFRDYSKKNNKNLTEKLYKIVTSLFFFHISGESENFHLNLQIWNPKVYQKVKNDRDTFKSIIREISTIEREIDEKMDLKQSCGHLAKQRDHLLGQASRIGNQYKVEI